MTSATTASAGAGAAGPAPRSPRAQAVVDLDAIRSNVARLAAATTAQVMAVVKADAYGHGLVPCARAALSSGATWLGVALLDEALALRSAGVGGRVFSWLLVPGDDVAAGVAADVDLSASATWLLDDVAAAARGLGRTARVHLKADTGLGRGGATEADWPSLVEHAVRLQADGLIEVVGLWSHLAWADAPGHPTIARQQHVFAEAVALAEGLGVRPEVRHLANSAATLTLPGAHLDLVRPGIAVYGLSPVPQDSTAEQLGLRPAMTLTARLALVKRVPAGTSVSYGHAWTSERETTLGVVPLGYADGLPRVAGNAGPLLAAGRRRTIIGRVCMDQVVIDLGDDPAGAGDEVVLFGPGDDGEPTAQDWADATGTISYEIVARIGPRVPRVHRGGDR